MKLLEPFKKLQLGYYRMFIVGLIGLPLIFGWVAAVFDRYNPLMAFIATFLLSGAIYYVLFRVILWIYEGFKQEKTK